MPRGRPKKNKVPFENLDEDFKTEVEALSEEGLRGKISQIAINEHEIREAKKQDQDLEEKRVAYSEAGETYRSSSKANRERTAYCYHLLEASGKV